MKTSEFDYIIVGAGTAGCVLANRLSSDPAKQVLLLEAGGRDSDPWIHVPFAWGKILQERRNDWGFDTEIEPGLSGRRLPVNRGKVLGGCSSVNAMAYVRGNPGDYDRWAANGLSDWSYEKILPYFRRAERWEQGGNAWRGDSGPVSTIRGRSRDPLHEAYRESALNVGIPWTDDYNGAQNEGIGYAQHAIRNGRRESGATAYLNPAHHRNNLKIVTTAHAHSILFEGTRAVGLRYERQGQQHEARAGREVLVSAGAIKSPQLLMLSGIGEASSLRKHDIDVRANLPGVGANLQDHLSAGVTYSRRRPGPIHAQMRADRAATNALRAILFGNGPMSILPTKYQAFVRTGPDQKIPDVQLLAGGATLGAHLWFPGIVAPYPDAFSHGAAVLHPKSRGRLELASALPLAPMKICFNFLSEPDDIAAIRRGIRLLRQIINRPEYDDFRGKELTPGPDVNDDASLDAYIRRSARTVYHPLGTCRMGADEAAVVDGELKVRGLDGLRVVDASVMPDLIGGNINAAVSMIAERASDLILASAH